MFQRGSRKLLNFGRYFSARTVAFTGSGVLGVFSCIYIASCDTQTARPSFDVQLKNLDENMWLTRDIGYWEKQMIVDFPPDCPGPRRCQCAHTTHFTSIEQIDPSVFKKAVEALVYNEPSFRARVDLTTMKFAPASDFSSLFTFRDLRGMSMKEAWASVVDVESNHAWDYDSKKPCYRCVLAQFDENDYLLVNTYHHAFGDGTSGMLASGKILGHYADLQAGRPLKKQPETPLESIETLTASNSGKFKVSDKMIKERTHRFKTYKPEVPYKLPEGIPINRSFVSTGCPDKFAMMRYRCKKEGVTVGNLALACTWMAMAQVIPGGKFSNMNYIDYPVNMRTRLGIGDAYCGFMVSEIMPRAKDVDQETSLWKLAKTMEKQVKQMLSEDQHFAFTGEVKKKFETGKATAETAAVPVENLLDVLLSNMMRYKAPLEPYPGLYIKGSYIPGGIWAPGFGNYLLLFQSTDRMHYTAVYNEPNAAVCDDLFDSWVMLMENAAHVKEGEDTFAKIKAKNGLVEKCF